MIKLGKIIPIFFLALYCLGFFAGLVLTFINNHFLQGTHGSYLWWANFVGFISVAVVFVVGIINVLIAISISYFLNLMKRTPK